VPGLPHPEENPVSSSASADELNPLLNPLLGQNMGRWAEVYFTAEPAARDQAVRELLDELRTQGAANANPDAAGMQVARFTDIAPASVRCNRCGAMSAAGQRFCGMCGVPLPGAAVSTKVEPASILDDREPAMEYLPVEDLLREKVPSSSGKSQMPEQNNASGATAAARNEPSGHDELSLFRSVAGIDRNEEAMDEDNASWFSGAGGKFVSVVLAVLLGGAAYFAWRQLHADRVGESAAGRVVQPSGKPVETSTAAETPATRESESGGSDESSKATAPAPAKTAATQATGLADDPASVPKAGSGAEELALAKRYLDGTDGQGRNSELATEWLWKSVAKKNGEATILLADRYLKGDGPEKNCDQARVLLDAAATKGLKAASERLQHLQAFGCQ